MLNRIHHWNRINNCNILNTMSTIITKDHYQSGYWVNGKYLRLEAYQENKHKFTQSEQKAIENYIKGLTNRKK